MVVTMAMVTVADNGCLQVVSGKTGSYANTIMMIVGVVTTVGISAFLMREAQKALEINGSASEKEPLAGGTPPMEARGTPRSRQVSLHLVGVCVCVSFL